MPPSYPRHIPNALWKGEQNDTGAGYIRKPDTIVAVLLTAYQRSVPCIFQKVGEALRAYSGAKRRSGYRELVGTGYGEHWHQRSNP